MSAQGRGTEKQPHDQYPSPPWIVSRYLEARPELATDLYTHHGGGWCEPCCGAGSIVRTLKLEMIFPAYNASRFPTWHLFDIDEKYAADMEELARPWDGSFTVGSFLDQDIPDRFFKLCITNPPYSIAADIAEACFMVSEETHLMLRLNFLGSEKRKPFFKQYGTPDVYVLPNRPSFFGDGSDSTEYAWMRWDADILEGRRAGTVHILDLTPDRIRAAAAAIRPGREEARAVKQKKLLDEEKQRLLDEINGEEPWLEAGREED